MQMGSREIEIFRLSPSCEGSTLLAMEFYFCISNSGGLMHCAKRYNNLALHRVYNSGSGFFRCLEGFWKHVGRFQWY